MRDTGKMAELCSSSAEPIFITKNGGSMAVYEEKIVHLEIREKILEGKAQADSGNLVDGDEAMKTIKERHSDEDD